MQRNTIQGLSNDKGIEGNRRARIYMHLKNLTYAFKYALKILKICTKNLTMQKYTLKIISKFAKF